MWIDEGTHLASANAGREWQRVAVEAHLVIEALQVARIAPKVPVSGNRVLHAPRHSLYTCAVSAALTTHQCWPCGHALSLACEMLALRTDRKPWPRTALVLAMINTAVMNCPAVGGIVTAQAAEQASVRTGPHQQRSVMMGWGCWG